MPDVQVAGQVSFANANSAAVTLPPSVGSEYIVILTAVDSPVPSVWVTSKTSDGFTIRSSVPMTCSIDWCVLK